jgi:predicted DNA-binding transcriptional regulator YafY
MMRIAARPVLARMLVIDQELRDGSWPNAQTLSRRLEVADRTIRRDIDYMRDQLHAPIAFDARKHGYVEDYLASSMSVFRGDGARFAVRLRFTGAAARFAPERLWHPNQEITTARNGDVLVSFEVTHLREAERLVLSWAPDCEALEPAELRDAIRNACARAARSHGSAAGKTKPNSARK